MWTHLQATNKNETKQVNQDQSSEMDLTPKTKSVNKEKNSDMDTPRNYNELKQVSQDQNSKMDTPRNFDKGAVGQNVDKPNSHYQQLEFPFTILQEDSTNSDAERFNLNNLDLNIEGYHSLIRQIVKLKHPEATPFTPAEPKTDVNREAVQLRYPEYWGGGGGQCVSDLPSDAHGRPYLIVCINVEEGLPSAPSRNTYFLDCGPSHLKFILNYLRNGAHVDVCMLPHEKP